MSLRPVTARRLLTRKEATALVGTPAPDAPPSFTDAVLIIDAATGAPQLVYAPVPGGIGELRREVLAVWANKPRISGQRASGMIGTAATFGSYPRRPIYGREGCTPTQLTVGNPTLHGLLLRHAEELSVALAGWAPAEYRAGRGEVHEVRPEWIMGESTWTSGVINRTSVLPYHRDAGNFRAWSAMPVLRRGVEGGHLHLPEYNLTVPCRDGWAVLFPGYELVHGVTPIKVRRPDGYRFSVVFYALRGMRDCATVALESARARSRRTTREQGIRARLDTGDPAPIRDYRQLGSVTRGQRRDPRISRKNSGRLIGGTDSSQHQPEGL